MKTDSLFYRLFQRAPALVFELAGLEAPIAGAYQFRAEEIKQTAFRLDDFVETILVYKLPKLSREEIQAMLGLIDTDLKQTRFYQEVFSEGRQEESVQLALRLLRRRFGTPLAAAHEQRICRLSLEQAEALMEALLDFRTPDDLGAWLATQEAPPI